MTLADAGRAQPPRPVTPRPLIEPRGPAIAGDAASPKFRLILWTNGRATVLSGLTRATGPGGAALLTTAQVRAQALIRQPRRPPGLVLLQVQSRSPAAQALSHLGVCNPPACAIEIDQLGPSGQVVVSHRLSGGTSKEQYDTNELEQIEFTFQKIEVENKIDSTSATDDWLAN